MQSVERALDVLNTLSTRRYPQSALEVSKRMGVHRTIVHRLLRTMAARHIVQEVAPGSYRLGSAIMQLATQYLDDLTLRRLALPHMVDLNSRGLSERGWHVTLGVPAPSQIVIVERVWDPQVSLDFLLSFPVGMPMTGSAAGAAFLARLDEKAALEWTSPEEYAALRPRLDEVNAAGGLSFSIGELMPGIGAMAIAIESGPNAPVGTLILSGPNLQEEFDPNSPVAQMVARTALLISGLMESVSKHPVTND